MRGKIPTFLVNALMADQLNRIMAMIEHFLSLRPLDDFEEEDGRTLGELFVLKRSEEKHKHNDETAAHVRCRILFEKMLALRELGER